MRAPKIKREVWHPYSDYDDTDIVSLQALATGTAQPHLQKHALDLIINHLAQTYDNGFIGDDPNGRIGAFIDGRQSVGQQIVKLLKLKPDMFRKETKANV